MARNPCKHLPCTTCPPGQSLDKSGKCVAAPVSPAPPAAAQKCPPGQTWNGAACILDAQAAQCAAGEHWNALTLTCEQTSSTCASFEGRAHILATEARGVNAQMMQNQCAQNPSTQACRDLTQRHDEILMRYRMLLNEAPSACRTTLPDPLSL